MNWPQYTRVYIEPVELWKSGDTNSPMGKLDQEDQQLLVNYFHTALSNSLSKDYTIVDHAGPGVLVVHAALTEARNPGRCQIWFPVSSPWAWP